MNQDNKITEEIYPWVWDRETRLEYGLIEAVGISKSANTESKFYVDHLRNGKKCRLALCYTEFQGMLYMLLDQAEKVENGDFRDYVFVAPIKTEEEFNKIAENEGLQPLGFRRVSNENDHE